MKNLLLLLAGLLLLDAAAFAQKFDVDTLVYHGDHSKYINLVILGDGYTAAEQTDFIKIADSFTQYFFSQQPFSNYAAYFNVFAVKVISNQSGAKHPKNASDCDATMPAANPDNYFGSTFDAYGIHRLVVANNVSKISGVLAANTPFYDQALILVNSDFYGGSGGEFPVATADFLSFEVAMHELGHSFAQLADEYWAGPQYAEEKANMTQENDASKVKWKNWLDAGTGIGIYPHQEDTKWHRPHQSCKMRYLNNNFCSVCTEAIIEKIHDMVNPVVQYIPQNTTIKSTDRFINFYLEEVMKPSPNTLLRHWQVNGKTVARNTDSFLLDQSELNNGTHTISLTVLDTTLLTRSNSHAADHITKVQWQLEKSVVGIAIESRKQHITLQLFPVPATNVLHISLETTWPENFGFDIVSADGKQMIQKATVPFPQGKTAVQIPVEMLPKGLYLIVVRIGNETITRRFVKQ